MKAFSILAIVLTATGISTQAQAGISYARVSSDGSPIDSSADIKNVRRESTGLYRISFRHDINGCTSVVTPTYFGIAGEPSIQGATAATQPQGTDLVVFTSGHGHDKEDHGFVVLTHCP